MPGFVQTPCAKCGATVWISPAAGMGYCPRCHTQNALPAGGGANPFASPPGAFGAPPAALPKAPFAPLSLAYANGRGGKTRLFFVAGVAIAMFGAGVVVSVKSRAVGKGTATYATLGLDPKNADVDKMIPAVAGYATRWKGDAAFWSINAVGVRPDGTIDLTSGESAAQVEYISPAGVQALAKSARQDTVKDFNFGATSVSFNRITSASDPWKGVVAPQLPRCSVKKLAASLAPKGLTGKKTFHLNFDPKFASLAGVSEQSWHVTSDDPKIDGWYSMATCAPTK